MKTSWILGLMICLFLWCPQRMNAQENGLDVVGRLIKEGYVNVRYTEQNGERVYSIENDTYKIQSIGISRALQIIQASLRGDETCKVVVTKYDVPQLLMVYEPHDKVPEDARIGLMDWKATYDVKSAWDSVKKEKVNNSSRFKVDLLIYPQLAFKNYIVNRIYQYLFDLSPSLEVALWPGGKIAGMVKIPVGNDGYGKLEDKIHPGHITLSQRFMLPYNIRGRVAVGCFNADRYGVDAQLFYPFKDQRFTLEGRVGYIGVGYWNGFNFHYDKDMSLLWSFGGSFFWPKYNTQFVARVQKFLLFDKGVKVEMIRHFRYASVGFYAEKSVDRDASMNGGFRFQVALPPYKQKRKGYLPRVTLSSQMGIVYNAGNERVYYKEYKTEASDNIMESNSFNPLYIQNEMYNF